MWIICPLSVLSDTQLCHLTVYLLWPCSLYQWPDLLTKLDTTVFFFFPRRALRYFPTPYLSQSHFQYYVVWLWSSHCQSVILWPVPCIWDFPYLLSRLVIMFGWWLMPHLENCFVRTRPVVDVSGSLSRCCPLDPTTWYTIHEVRCFHW